MTEEYISSNEIETQQSEEALPLEPAGGRGISWNLPGLIQYARDFLNKGHPRSRNLKKNIGASFILKAVSIILSLIKVPILLSYLDPEKYGVWLTIASLLEWMGIFDLGLGHGLRNRFAEAQALGDEERSRGLVSTAYVSMSAIMLSMMVVVIPLVYLLDWNKVLNTQLITNGELRSCVLMVSMVFLARFVMQLISVLLKAMQKPALSDVFLPISGMISLALIPVMKLYVSNSLFWASAIIAIPPLVVLFIANVYFFFGKYAAYRPSLKFFHKRMLGDIYSLGWKFFVGQITALILFSSSNIILAQAVNPQEVTIYSIANKYFSLPIAYFMIIVTPYWSAVTDAYYRDEMGWIKSNMRQILYVSGLFCFGLAVMLLLSNLAFRLWVGSEVHIPWRLCLLMTVYNVGVVFMAPYNMFLNGFGKLKLGTRVAIIKTVVYLPIAWFLSKAYGASGLVVALLVANMLPNVIVSVKQYSLIVNKQATGIWDQ